MKNQIGGNIDEKEKILNIIDNNLKISDSNVNELINSKNTVGHSTHRYSSEKNRGYHPEQVLEILHIIHQKKQMLNTPMVILHLH